MPTYTESKTIQIAINRQAKDVYLYVYDLENYPNWVAPFCQSIRQEDSNWIIETTYGSMKIRVAAKNDFGVLDYFVTASGVESYDAIRVIPNGSNCEVYVTVFQQNQMSDEEFKTVIGTTEYHLKNLKEILENEKN